MNLSEDEIETIKALINDWGFEYSLSAKREKVCALAEKLGMDDWARSNKL